DGIRDRNVTGVQTCALPILDWDNHILRENDFQYEQIAGQLQNLQNLAVALIAIASVLSIVILMLILMMRIRGRIHEAGIYLSVRSEERRVGKECNCVR